jgi:hypothetical protein
MRSCLSLLLVQLFAFGVLVGRARASSTAVESEFSAPLSYLEGDVRLSLGREGEPYIGKEWIDACRNSGWTTSSRSKRRPPGCERTTRDYTGPRAI